ncbi:MAG: tyrosine-type recombinase/integrase [Chloroflexota bacterium]|nr:tyrosine-type recombinase/integrase [Chloroflexota bacterium]
MTEQQISLPSEETLVDERAFSTNNTSLAVHSSLNAAVGEFHEHMIRQGFTENTIKSFLGDMRIVTGYLGADKAVGEIATKDLNDFLLYLLYERGKPCSPKSYARRVTTLKVFFGWLAEVGVLAHDPSAAVVHRPTSTPLPTILYEEQIKKLLETTRRLMQADKPDVRPHLLVRLLLSTGIKKGECMSIQLSHIDLSDPAAPALYIHYDNPKMRHKERKLKLPADLVPIVREYLEQYKPQTHLFPCTARNLEYVLRDAGQAAAIPVAVGFETLRWTAAVQDYKSGMSSEALRQKLGLSRITWNETVKKLKKLAGPAL